jgi:dihydrofolate reductase
MLADQDLHRHATRNLAESDAILLGRVTYEMMEAAFRGVQGRKRTLTGWTRLPAASTP